MQGSEFSYQHYLQSVRVPDKTAKTLRIIWYDMVASCCTNPNITKKKSPLLVLVRARTTVPVNYFLDIPREKSNPTLWNHILKLQLKCRSPQKARKLLSLCHTVVKAQQESVGGWCTFGSAAWLELWQNFGMSYKKNTEVEVLPVPGLFKEPANYHFFVGGATQV